MIMDSESQLGIGIVDWEWGLEMGGLESGIGMDCGLGIGLGIEIRNCDW